MKRLETMGNILFAVWVKLKHIIMQKTPFPTQLLSNVKLDKNKSIPPSVCAANTVLFEH